MKQSDQLDNRSSSSIIQFFALAPTLPHFLLNYQLGAPYFVDCELKVEKAGYSMRAGQPKTNFHR